MTPEPTSLHGWMRQNDEEARKAKVLASSRKMKGIREKIDTMHEYAKQVIAAAMDPAFPKKKPVLLERHQLEEDSPTVEDKTQLPVEETAITADDQAELEQLPEPVRTKLKAILHVA